MSKRIERAVGNIERGDDRGEVIEGLVSEDGTLKMIKGTASDLGYSLGYGRGEHNDLSPAERGDPDVVNRAAGEVRELLSGQDTFADDVVPEIRDLASEMPSRDEEWVLDELWDEFDEGFHKGYVDGVAGEES